MLDIGTSFLIQFTDTALHKCAVCSATLRDNVDGLLTAELWEKDDDIEYQLSNLKYVLDEEIKARRGELEYVDLRLGNKVYYKYLKNID